MTLITSEGIIAEVSVTLLSYKNIIVEVGSDFSLWQQRHGPKIKALTALLQCSSSSGPSQ